MGRIKAVRYGGFSRENCASCVEDFCVAEGGPKSVGVSDGAWGGGLFAECPWLKRKIYGEFMRENAC